MKAIFRMGVPVMGKNYFPSNIQGLPTWYEIRVTREGYVARSGRVDLMVAMNAETYARDVREVSLRRLPDLRLDLAATDAARARRHHDPRRAARKICNENFEGVRARILMKNIMLRGRARGAARPRPRNDQRAARAKPSPRSRRWSTRT